MKLKRRSIFKNPPIIETKNFILSNVQELKFQKSKSNLESFIREVSAYKRRYFEEKNIQVIYPTIQITKSKQFDKEHKDFIEEISKEKLPRIDRKYFSFELKRDSPLDSFSPLGSSSSPKKKRRLLRVKSIEFEYPKKIYSKKYTKVTLGEPKKFNIVTISKNSSKNSMKVSFIK